MNSRNGYGLLDAGEIKESQRADEQALDEINIFAKNLNLALFVVNSKP